jgi:SNF2 family DNA or RNA helicase
MPAVLHAIWSESAERPLQFWIEAAHTSAITKHRHPAARGHAALRRTLAPWLGDVLIARASDVPAELLLPTRAGRPMASPEQAARTTSRAATSFKRWLIPALAARDPSLALRRLARRSAPAGIVLGASTRYWLAASELIETMVERGCFAPYAGDAEHTLLARWSPIYDAWASASVRALAAVMPGVCRAVIPPDTAALDYATPDAQAMLTGFIEHMLDRRVRRPVRRALKAELEREAPGVLTRWLRRLIGGPTHALVYPRSADELETAEALRAWLSPFHIAPQARGRLCVELSAPPDAEIDAGDDHNTPARWPLRYFLQDIDEPSVLVPARQIWLADGRDAAIAQRRFIDAERALLEGLALAARHCAPIAESLTQSAPTEVALTVEQAHAFLSMQTTALEAAGIGVRLPVWWAQREKVKIALQLSDRAAFFGLDTLVRFNWQAAIGDVVLSRAEFETLARMQAPLAYMRGQWVEVNPDNLRRALRYFDRRKAGMPLGEALRADAGGGEDDIGVEIDSVETSGQTRAFFDRLRGSRTLAPVAAPPGFTGKLRPYQQRGLSWLSFLSEHGLGACLADDMGLGKTVQLLALIQHWRALDEASTVRKARAPVLLICPMSILGNWRREAERFAPDLRVLTHHGLGRHDAQAFTKAICGHDMVLTTYALAHRDRAAFASVEWRAIVLDEAQNIKNSANKQTRAIKTLRARQRIALTGTPVENGLGELWSIMDFLNPGQLGPRETFTRRFGRPVESGNAERASELRRIVQPFLLRRVKSNKEIIADLPDKFEHTVHCTLTREQATLYQAVTKRMLDAIADADYFERGRLIVSALMRLKQVCNHPAHYLHDHSRLAGRSGKLARLEEMLEEALSAGGKALVFSQYTDMAGPLAQYLRKRLNCEVLYLHGAVGRRQRDEMVWRFQEQPNGPPVFVLSLKAGGTGLNLTAANHVFHYDRWWNPAVENQATDRAYRIGQTRDVQVHKLVCIGTLEERIDQLLRKKRALAEQIVGDGESWLNDLSTDQLRSLFTLGPDAVVG